MNRDKLKLIGEVDKEKDFDEQEFEKLWASEVVGVVAAKKSFKKMSAKDFESLETQNKVKQKEKWKKGYSNTKQEDDF